jgi:hypothetical protein
MFYAGCSVIKSAQGIWNSIEAVSMGGTIEYTMKTRWKGGLVIVEKKI